MTDKLILSTPDFEETLVKEYDLNLEVSANSFNYCIIDANLKSVKSVAHIPSLIYNFVNGSILQNNFKKIKIGVLSQKFTFIPLNVYQEKDLNNYSVYLNPTENENVYVQKIDQQDLVIIYVLPKLQVDKLEHLFPNATIYPQFVPLNAALHFAYQQINFSQLFINFKTEGFLEISIIDNQKFIFYNIFSYQNIDEMMYFILLSLQQNQIRPSRVTVKISGEIAIDDDKHQKLKKEFPNTEFIDQDCLPLTYKGLGEPIVAQFFSLLSLHLCE
jgi:hypothetical protein